MRNLRLPVNSSLYLYHMPKFLIVRFSSIGDIVLTSPVIRCLKMQVPEAEVHFVTKSAFQPVVENNPYLSKIFYLDNNEKELLTALKKEKYDAVIDLHNNLRSAYFSLSLGIPSYRFRKLNAEKWLLVNFKIDLLPVIHIVDRYMETVRDFGVVNDGKGLDYFAGAGDAPVLPEGFSNGYIALAIGALHATKAIPVPKITEIIRGAGRPVVLLGGKDDIAKGEEIVSQCTNYTVYNGAGNFSLNESALIVRNSDLMITGDTGLMHIAAAYEKKIISVWGNTVPEFGMYPYVPDSSHSFAAEVKGLSCRPCSKLGYEKCPLGHFKCMLDISTDEIVKKVSEWYAGK